MSTLLPNAFVCENAKILDFIETTEIYELEVATTTWLSEYMNTYEYHMSRSFVWPFVQGHLNLYFETSAAKPLSQSKPNSMWSLNGMGERKFAQDGLHAQIR